MCLTERQDGCRVPLMSNWTNIESSLPDEGRLLEVTTSSGAVQQCRKQGNLFWTPDMVMYVYYTPVMWRYID